MMDINEDTQADSILFHSMVSSGFLKHISTWFHHPCNITFRLVCVDMGISGVLAPNTSAHHTTPHHPALCCRHHRVNSSNCQFHSPVSVDSSNCYFSNLTLIPLIDHYYLTN